MKVLALKFKNLNSLKGDHTIDFTLGSFSHSGIFAITGPTGAGKTTILDAITLGLYGRVARYSKSQPVEVMSRHTGDCFSEVHFATAEGRFGARWEVRRARGRAEGAMQSPKRSVFVLDTGEILVERVREVDEWIEAAIGLDYDRFLRSVLLAQGEFTAFLKASGKERGVLLERLTGMGIYAELSQLAYHTTKEKRERLEVIEEGLRDLKLLSEEERYALIQTTEEVRHSETMQRRHLDKVRSHLEVVKKFEEWKVLSGKCDESRVKWEADCDGARGDLLLLKVHRKTEPYAESIRQWKELTDTLPRLRNRKALLVANQKKLKVIIQETNDRWKDRQDQLEQAIECVSKSRVLVDQVIPIDERLKGEREKDRQLRLSIEAARKERDRLTQEVNELSGRLKQNTEQIAVLEKVFSTKPEQGVIAEHIKIILPLFTKWREDARQLIEREQVMAERSKRLSEINESLERSRSECAVWKQREAQAQEKQASEERELAIILGGHSIEFWEKRQRQLGEERLRVRPALDRLERREERATKLKALRGRVLESRVKLSEYTDQIELAEVRYEEEKLAIELKENAVRRNLEVAALRAELRDDHPCPVCGSTTHPGSKGGGSEEDLMGLEERSKNLAEYRKLLDKQITERVLVNERLRVSGVDEAELQKEIAELNLEVEDLLEDLSLPRSCYDPAPLSAHYLTLQQEQLRVDQRIAELRIRQSAIASHVEVRQRAQKQCQQVNGFVERELGQVQEVEKAHQEDKERKADLEARVRNGEITLRRRLDELTIDSQKVIGSTPEAVQAIADEWDLRKKAYLNLKQDGEKALIKCEALEAAKLAAHALLIKVEQEASRVRQEIIKLNEERAKLCGELDPFLWRKQCEEKEKQGREQLVQVETERARKMEELSIVSTRLDDLAKEYDLLTSQHSQVENDLTLAAKELGWDSLAELVASHLSRDRVEQLEHCERSLRERELECQTIQRQLAEDQKKLEEAAQEAGWGELKDVQVDELTDNLVAQQAENDRLKRELWNLEHQIKEDAARRHEQAVRQHDCDRARAEWRRWSAVDRLIGSADGAVFSRFAQSLTLGCLVRLANRHLQRLTDRYQIVQKDPADLEIEVIDRYQANTVRGMQSLSGGEAFLISLGLALGLSALAGGRIRIDSLFIDEGFGSLDAETLETAIAALEGLQAQNKMIGVISHMELLKERIGTQIQVVPGEGGVSRLRVV